MLWEWGLKEVYFKTHELILWLSFLSPKALSMLNSNENKKYYIITSI